MLMEIKQFKTYESPFKVRLIIFGINPVIKKLSINKDGTAITIIAP